MKKCYRCKEEKDLENFRNYAKSKDGKMGYCKTCHSAISMLANKKRKDIVNELRRLRRKNDPEYKEKLRNQKIISYWKNKEASLLRQAKQSLKRRGISCEIVLEDIIIPEICPIFNIPFDKGRFSPSLDRIDNNKGYTKDNIWVISRLANTMKNDATISELITFCKNLPNLIKHKMI